MCGICGGFTSKKVVEAGTLALKHRGPDAKGLIRTGNAWFGHTRLAIMDLDTRSNQPFTYGGTTITFNGEIWNYKELRAQLKRAGLKFETTGDTEVLAAALDHWGVAALPKISGMFAVAWTCEDDDVVCLARDRFGEIPVHFSTKPFRFASEMKALVAMGVSPDKIYSVPPSAFVKALADDDVVHVKDYYDVPAGPTGTSDLKMASVVLCELLRYGAKARAMTDVPACVLLSGGIDSSAIAWCLKPHLPGLVGYTAVMDEKSRDLRCARAVAEAVGIDLVEVRVPPPSSGDLKSVVRMIEMPYKAQVEIGWPCVHLARAMRSDGFKVTFGGEGSDELWASYGFAYYALDQQGQDWHQYRKRLFLDQARKNFPRSNKIFMQAGVECRLPFLHETVVEYALGLPRRAVQRKGRPKAVIQEAFRGKLPKEVVERPKVAFQDGLGVKRDIAERIERPKDVYQAEYDLVFGRRTKTLWQ